MVIPVTEICNNLGEDCRVGVLTELHQDEPVSKVKSLHDDSDVLEVTGLGPQPEYKNARWSKQFRLVILTR